MESYRIEVGHTHGVKPANIVGAIANEAGLESRYIGRIDIQDDYSILDLPADMPRELLTHLKKVWVSGQQLNMRKLEDGEAAAAPSRPRFRAAASRPAARMARTVRWTVPARRIARARPSPAASKRR